MPPLHFKSYKSAKYGCLNHERVVKTIIEYFDKDYNLIHETVWIRQLREIKGLRG